jgi:hypothetical protein
MQPTPLQPEQCGGQGTPSPLSPTPSPAGSVGSVGSQSSGYNSGDVAAGRMVGGSSSGVVGGSSMGQQPPAANMGPCVAVPLSVHSAMQKQNQHYSYLLSCHELWEQADLLVYKGKHKGNVVLSCQYKLKMWSLYNLTWLRVLRGASWLHFQGTVERLVRSNDIRLVKLCPSHSHRICLNVRQ